MYPFKSTLAEMFTISKFDWKRLMSFRRNPIIRNIAILFVIGTLGTFITLIGMFLGFVRAYKRIEWSKDKAPEIYPLTPQTRVGMILGGLGIWVALIISLFILYQVSGGNWIESKVMLIYFVVNMIFMIITFGLFKSWAIGYQNLHVHSSKFGSAKWASFEETTKYLVDGGLYVGGGYVYKDKGHLITFASTRSGKGTNLIVPNLLGVGNYEGSFIVTDPKAENAAITASYQRKKGNNVVILNPWNMLYKEVGESSCFNPLDLLSDPHDINLIDDAQMIAEMLVPMDRNDKDKFFTDTARNIIAGLIAHIVINCSKEDRNLATLWEMLRYKEDKWLDLISEMLISDDGPNAEIVIQTANEIRKLMETGEKTYGNIVATMLQSTDFLKSPALRESLKSGYNPYDLTEGKTTIYICIPVDKLKSHSRWLRLINVTCMRAVIRRPAKRVTFILDEFAALGYISEIENALSTYAGYNLSIWPILQDISQLKANYSDSWETFIANSAVRTYFNVNDNFSAEYISASIGTSSHVLFTRNWFKIKKIESNQRPLLTPTEVMRGSQHQIIAMIGGNNPTYFGKLPYYEMEELKQNGQPLYDENPYMKDNIKYADKKADPGTDKNPDDSIPRI